MFSGKFQTGLYPDEWNWRMGRDREDLTRQICNGWKSDLTIASIVLHADVGEACARLRRWPGARIGQDNVIWKPPGTKPLGFHQDDSYNGWIEPGEMNTCWITLDDTKAYQGTIEYVRGSHKWPISPPIKQFHAPDDPLNDLYPAAASAGVSDYEIVPIEVPAGSCVIHHGRTWHGSRDNKGERPRRSAIAHCISSAARFHPTKVSYIYSRYKRADSLEMDESYFPVLWREDGYRTSWLDSYIAGKKAA
jgi:ectoine hydroxylase-related dioxygenase (phytanoyl-CoA dioxygenase family)